jgi:excisionase family DNA binding protein
MQTTNPFDEILQKLNGIENQLRFITNSTPTNSTPDWLNVQQAADYLNLSKQTIYRKVSEGKIPYYKAGKKLHFRKSELFQIVELGKIDAV